MNTLVRIITGFCFSLFIISNFLFGESKEIDQKILEEIKTYTPIYADSYSKEVNGVVYGIGLGAKSIISRKYNISNYDRQEVQGKKLLGYRFPDGMLIIFVNDEKFKAISIKDSGTEEVMLPNAAVRIHYSTIELPIIPKNSDFRSAKEEGWGSWIMRGFGYFNRETQNDGYYNNFPVILVSMEVAPKSISNVNKPGKEEKKGEFDPALRHLYVKEVRALKSIYLSAIDLNSLDETNPKDAELLEQFAIRMNEERRRIGVKYKNATPQTMLDQIYKRNLKKYGDKLGPTISYLRNVQGKSWREIIESSYTPGGRDWDLIGLGNWTSENYGYIKYEMYGAELPREEL